MERSTQPHAPGSYTSHIGWFSNREYQLISVPAPFLINRGVASVAYSAQDGVILAAGASCEVVALDAETGKVVSSFTGSKHAITCLAITSGELQKVAIWDA